MTYTLHGYSRQSKWRHLVLWIRRRKYVSDLWRLLHGYSQTTHCLETQETWNPVIFTWFALDQLHSLWLALEFGERLVVDHSYFIHYLGMTNPRAASVLAHQQTDTENMNSSNIKSWYSRSLHIDKMAINVITWLEWHKRANCCRGSSITHNEKSATSHCVAMTNPRAVPFAPINKLILRIWTQVKY